MQAVATNVSSVTVYRNGALVVREGKARGDVDIAGLPLLFASETLRVRPSSGSVRNLEETVKLEVTPAALPPDDAARSKLLLDIAAIDDRMRTLEALLESLDGLEPVLPDARSGIAAPVDGRAFVDFVSFASARAADVRTRHRALEVKRRELERDRRKLDERSAAVPASVPRVTRGVRFELDGEVSFALEYFVPAARWVPTYALHLDAGRAKLVTAALVAQASGEDWRGARLSVCTADLSREATLPTLSSWRIGRAQPAVARAFRPLPTDLPSLFFGYDQGPRKLLDPSSIAPTTPPVGEAKKFDDKLSSGELRSFEQEKTGEVAAMELGDEMEPESAPSNVPYDGAVITRTGMGFIPPPAPMAPGAMPRPSAAPRMQAMETLAAAKSAPMRARGGFAFGSGGGGRDEDSGAAPVVQSDAELPPRLRTAYMRMAGADERARGSLLPLDVTARLEWLLDAHDVDNAGRATLKRAIDELRRAHQRLESQPLPRGTTSLLGTHFPSVLSARTQTDVPGDGTFYRVEVRVDEGAAAIEHKAVPRESNDVWRTCRLEVTGAPLPAGPLVVYEDGAFRVNARLDGSGGGKPLDVNLGVDPDVRVVSRTVHVNQSEAGIVSSKSKVVHKVRMEVRSTRKEPAKIVLFDRLPVPHDTVKDVVVNVVEEKPPIKRTNKDAHGNEVAGAFEWRLTVMPGDTQAVDFSYAIELPAKTELEGGNRRD